MIWFMKLIRILLAAIDIVVYWLLELVYSLFIAISSAGIFSQATIQSFATRIYVFLGLIMVFKVSISLVTYIMNPDNFSKGDVGAPALLKGFIFALVGIVLVPYAFEIAYSFQRVILKENVIGNLILGMGHDENSEFSENFIKSGGKYMADTVYNAFYRPNEELVGDECLADPGDCDMSEYFEADVLEKYEDAYGEEDGAPLSVIHRLDWDILNATTNNDEGDTVFVMDYTYLITTLIGGFITYILLLFCIDIAVRSVKLCFLQLIAPIPLISKVDPKKGDKVFGNWMKECVSTYLDVFMRLLAIYFALFIISSISLQPINMVEGGTFDGFLGLILAVFLIIGTLNFARELPKLIGGIFGIDFKGMGGFSLNPMKNKNFAPVAALGAGATGFAAGMATGGLGGGLIGAAGGLGRGLIGSFGGKNGGDILKNQAGFNHDKLMNQNYSTMARLGNIARSYTGGLSPVDRAGMTADGKQIDEQVKDIDEHKIAPLKEEKGIYDNFLSKNKEMRNIAESEILKGADSTSYSADILGKKNMIDVLKSQAGNISRSDYASDSAYQTAIEDANRKIVDAETDYNSSLKAAVDNYIDDVNAGGIIWNGEEVKNTGISNCINDIDTMISSNAAEFAASGVTTISGDRYNSTANLKALKNHSESKSYQTGVKISEAEAERSSLVSQKRSNMHQPDVARSKANPAGGPGGRK